MVNNIKRKVFGLIFLILVPAIAACGSTPVSASAIYEVASDLWCVCGCDIVLNDCHCETAEQLNKVIKKGLSRGELKAEIIQGMVRQYGQRIIIE